MSTSLLYHGFGIRGYRYVRTDFFEGEVVFQIEQERHTYRCPACGALEVTAHGTETRLFRCLPIGGKATHVLFAIPRVECQSCRVTRQVQVDFADPRRRYTHAFERYALELSRYTTIQDAARHLGVSWDTVKDIQKRYLESHFGKPKLKHLRRLAIDEIAVGKGHRYLTVVLDLESGAARALRPWSRFGDACAPPERRSKPSLSICPPPTSRPSRRTCPERSSSSTIFT